ncbi:MAG: hypothetical protein A2035_06365 [Nitrospirae bacterium GWA2_42_11]|nr:MAG: hypothetical protein A2035_06365 [Nitrospirae bacterium GWA2_42_11]
MRITPEIGDVSIVLIGNFNPVIFRPEWFENHAILSNKDTEQTNLIILHKEISDFHNEWLRLQVQTNRFYAETSEYPYVRLFDFVVKTFKDYLSHTPISQIGINRRVHFSVENNANRDRIGKVLAPREPWGKWGALIDAGEGEEHGGMKSLTMAIKKLDDREKGIINITVEPSPLVKVGIYVNINDHYELSNPDEHIGSDKIIDLLINRYDESLKRSEEIIDQIMELV